MQHLLQILIGLTFLGSQYLVAPVFAAPHVERPKEVVFYGFVRDTDEQPIVDCELTIASPSPDPYPRFPATELLSTGLAQQKTTTANDGSFRFTIDTTDSAWIGPGTGAITARTKSGQFSVTSYRLARGLIDLPFEIQISAAANQAVRVVDPSGQPLPGIKVSPARYGDILLPLEVSSVFEGTTDAQGTVQLPATDRPLTGLIAIDLESNHQFLIPNDESSGPQRVVLKPSIIRHHRCLLPDGAKPSDIGRIAWTLVSARGSGDQMEFAWQRTISHGIEPIAVKLPHGSFFALNDAHQGHNWHNASRDIVLTEEANVEIQLQRGLHVTGKVLANDSGHPLPGIGLYSSSEHPVQSGLDGTYELWLPRISGGTYPSDPLDEYFSSDPFFKSPAAEHAPGEARIQPFEMQRRAATLGTVLDPDGKPAAGFTVTCESKRERFTNTAALLTDRHGRFRFSNVADGTPVKLTVMDRRGVTPEPVEVTLKPDEPLVIRLVEPSPKRLQGRVVDATGKPVAGATVEVRQGRVSIAEGFGPARYAMVDAFDAAKRKRFLTDVKGRFETDEVVDWRNVFGLKLTHADHYETLSGLRHVDRSPSEASQFDFGDITMKRLPSEKSFTVKTVGPTGEPIQGAKVLFIQARDGAGQSNTDENGVADFNGKRVNTVVAVRHGDATVFAMLAEDQSEITLTLSTEEPSVPWQGVRGTLSQRRAVARKLLKNFELAESFDVASASDGEIHGVLSAVVYANPTAVVSLITTKRAELEKRPDASMMLIQKAIERNAELAPVLSPFLPSNDQVSLALLAFEKNTSAAQREDLLSQAITLAKKLDGDDAAVKIGRIAMQLLHQGDLDLASELVEEVYVNQKADFDSQIGSRGKVALARFYFPQFAIIDFEKACESIRRHSNPNEMDTLQTLALILGVLAGKTDWESGLAHLGRVSLGVSEQDLVSGVYGKTPLPNEHFVESLLTQLKDGRLRALLCMHAAARMPTASLDVQKKWLRRGVDLLSQTSVDSPGHQFDSTAHLLREDLAKLGQIDPVAARIIAFRCLEELIPFRDGQYYYLAERIATAAEPLAKIAPELSRCLLEPFLDDLTWYQRNGAADQQILPLATAARVDPNWAGEVAQRIIDGHMRDDKLRQITVLSSVVDGLASGEADMKIP
jgi:uncharacterized GH25 family protein